VLDCAGINFIDSQGSAKMNDVVTLARDSGITLRLARLKAAVSATLARDGVLQRIGAGNIHGNVDTAVQAQLEASAPPSSGGPSEAH
jgi:SulP family sulfate permease